PASPRRPGGVALLDPLQGGARGEGPLRHNRHGEPTRSFVITHWRGERFSCKMCRWGANLSMMEEPHSSSTDSLPTRRSLLTRLKCWDDREGWQRFYDSYHGLILAMVRNAGLHGADAEEVAQEALVAVARGMKEFHYDPAKGSFKGWLKTVVRRRLVDFLRKQGRERSHLREYVETGAAEAEP